MSFKKKKAAAQSCGAGQDAVNADLDEIMKKYDKESNTRIWEGMPKIVIRCILAAFSLFCIWSTLFSTAGLEERLSLFVGLLVIMGYLNYPISKKHVTPNTLPWYDIIIMALGAGAFLYFSFKYMDLVTTITSASSLRGDWFHIAVGVIGVLSVAELCRRCVGIPILCVVSGLLIYTFASGLGLRQVTHILFYTTNGIFSAPIQVCAKYIVIFIIFGAFLERTGIANYFISLANSVAGSASGGPAKVAVISSALCGMVSGSSVGNTVTTGSITIPMMKDTGYKPEFAGAVEASASTGGQIMPPIMGAAAFLMAEYLGVGYPYVVLRAIIPALLYFTGIFIAVHLEARKLGLKGISRENLPKMGHLIKKVYLLLPLGILIYLVSANVRSLQFSAIIAIGTAIIVSLFDWVIRVLPSKVSESRETGDKSIIAVITACIIEGVNKLLETLEAGGKSSITVGVACGMAGMIAGCITVTGLASKLITGIVSLSGGITIIALLLTMICCIILGMGVPTTANYCIMASTCAPILITLGFHPVAAHFFVFYFGIVADITPPVALAAFAGAAIAKADPIKTGIAATRLACAAFIVPFIFVYNPEMLVLNEMVSIWDWLTLGQIVISALIGLYGVSAGLGGFMKLRLSLPLRILAILGGLGLIIPGTFTDLIGIAIIGAILLIQIVSAKKTGGPSAA